MSTVDNDLLGTGQVAEELGVPRYRLIALLDAGRLPEASVRVPGRRLFTRKDVEEIRRTLAEAEASE